MGLRFPSQQYCSCFFATTPFRDHRPFGSHPGVYEALCDSLSFYSERYKAKVSGYVLMPTHLHLLVFIDGRLLAALMRDFKKFVCQKSARDLGIRTDSLWMPRYDRVAIESEEVFRTKLTYIHNNPIKAGLCAKAENWTWSSAGDYLIEKPGPVAVWKEWR